MNKVLRSCCEVVPGSDRNRVREMQVSHPDYVPAQQDSQQKACSQFHQLENSAKPPSQKCFKQQCPGLNGQRKMIFLPGDAGG